MTLLSVYFVFIGACFFALFFITMRLQTSRYIHGRKRREKVLRNSLQRLYVFRKSIIPIFLAVTFFVLFSYTAAIKHGMTHDVPITELYYAIQNTPTISEPDTLNDCIVVLYRFDCSDCHQINRELNEAALVHENIYFVPSDSSFGKQLTEKYQISSVPTGLSFKQQSVVQKKLFYNDHFDRTAFQRLLEHQNES